MTAFFPILALAILGAIAAALVHSKRHESATLDAPAELYEMKTTVVNSGFNYTAKQYAAAEVINWTGMCFFFVVLKLSLLQ